MKDLESVLVVRDDTSTDEYTGEDPAAMNKFVKTTSIPLLGELSRGNAQICTELVLPICLFFQEPGAKDAEVRTDFVELAKKHYGGGKLPFAWINKLEFKSFMDVQVVPPRVWEEENRFRTQTIHRHQIRTSRAASCRCMVCCDGWFVYENEENHPAKFAA